MLGLYLHIPFCGAICHYCNFNRGLLDAGLKARYVDALETEIRRAADGSAADTIYFGGGTPSLLAPAEVGRLIAACRESFAVTPDAEVTLELNPETATPDYLTAIRAAGCQPPEHRRAVLRRRRARPTRPGPFGRPGPRGRPPGARAPASTTSASI